MAWASQPGMIRTYDKMGVARKFFKLYSSDQMVQDGASFSPVNELKLDSSDSATAWMNNPAFFTDLNSPIVTPRAGKVPAKGNFPIIDGNGIILKGTTLTYKDPNNTPEHIPEGFSVTPSQVSYNENADLSVKNNPVPLPAKWLYVLENGRIVAPVMAASGNGKLATVAGADKSPIVGRIAFWTDDETAKVNINTASEGTFWDMPRAEGTTERNFGSYQPATREFQRYPGHPATTSLSAVFPWLTTANKSTFYALAPRVSATGANATGTPSPGGVTLDHDRLYSTLDELAYDPSLDTTVNPPVRKANPSSNPLQMDDLRRARFFATAYNRAPEVNLFNKPRITIWPIDTSFATNSNNYKSATPNARVTPTDQLIAFCSTLKSAAGTFPYYFQRNDPNSASELKTIGRNEVLYKYLQTLTGGTGSVPDPLNTIPGFGGGNFFTKYGADRDQILTEIFDYIRSVNLTDATLGGGMPPGNNTVMNTFAPARPLKSLTPNGNLLSTANSTYPFGHGLVTPTEYPSAAGVATRGFGRFDTVSGAFLWFAGIAQTEKVNGTVTVHNQDGTDTAAPATPSPPLDYTRVQAIFALDFFDPGYNWPYPMCGFEYKISGLDKFQWRRPGEKDYISMQFPDGTPVSLYWKGNQMPGGRQGFALALSQKKTPDAPRTTPPILKDCGRDFYPFCGGVTSVPGSATLNSNEFPSAGSYIDFKGGDITISLMFNKAEIQNITLNVPDGRFPVPGLASSNYLPSRPPARNFRYFFSAPGAGSNALGGRFYSDTTAIYVYPTDTIEEIVSTSGDYRTIAGLRNITTTSMLDAAPYNLFRPHPQYGDGVTHFAHNLWGEGRFPILGATYGALANGAVYGSNPASDTSNWNAEHATTYAGSWWGNLLSTTGVAVGSSTPATSTSIPGDWDNGMADEQDGPYINKVDEGNLWGLDPNGTATAGSVPYFTSNYNFLYDPTAGKSYFSPNRQIPSAGMFGSLSTGVNRHLPWQTLLFRPGPAGHPGLNPPADHLILDLFTMPVAEPYAISEPFSTAGRVNMNYQIMPYTYFTRETAIRAALKSEKVMAIPTNQGPNYKSSASNSTYRFEINLDETLNGFRARFNSNYDIFKSASEICSIHLVPQITGTTYSSMSTFWNNYRLTGDNTRERPYANIYPRLTTKSNTYTVHYRAQALKKNTARGSATQWDESTDTVVGEFRGSSLIERYIDPNDPALPDFVTDLSKKIDDYYRLRIINTKQFDQ